MHLEIPPPSNVVDDIVAMTATLQAEMAAALASARLETDQLEATLQANYTIGTAVGILVERFGVPPNTAYDQLTAVAVRNERQLLDVAADVIHTKVTRES